MRHILTLLITFYWMAVFASLAMVSTLNPEHGILAALTFLGAAPTPDAYLSGGGPLAAGFFSFAFAVACVLFLWTLATAFFGEGLVRGNAERVTRLAFGAGVGAFSLLLVGSVLFSIPGLFLTSAVAIAALLASYLSVFVERWLISIFAGPTESDLRAAARVVVAGAAHAALLSRISGRPSAGTLRGSR